MRFMDNIKGAFASTEAADSGSLVETVLIIAGFAVVAILVVTWIGNSIAGQASNVANCIANANASDISTTNSTCTNNNGLSNTIRSQVNNTKGGRF